MEYATYSNLIIIILAPPTKINKFSQGNIADPDIAVHRFLKIYYMH